jgi:hypothetical protein
MHPGDQAPLGGDLVEDALAGGGRHLAVDVEQWSAAS